MPDPRSLLDATGHGTATVLKVLAGALAVTVVADLLVHHHAAFGVDGTIGFGAWFGLLAAVALLGLAEGVGTLLQREEADDA